MIDKIQPYATWRRAYAFALAAILVFPACNVDVKKKREWRRQERGH